MIHQVAAPVPPEVLRFARVIPEPGGAPCVLVALEARAADLLGQVPGLVSLRDLLAPWALVAWLRPDVLTPLAGPELVAALATPPPGNRWVLIARDGQIARTLLRATLFSGAVELN